MSFTTTQALRQDRILAPNVAINYDITHIPDPLSWLVVYNESTTATLTYVYSNAFGAVSVDLPPGKFDVQSDVDPTAILTFASDDPDGSYVVILLGGT